MMKDFYLTILCAVLASANVMMGVHSLTGNWRAGFSFGSAAFMFYLVIAEIAL